MEEYETRKGGYSVNAHPNAHVGKVRLLHKREENGMVTYSCTYTKCNYSSPDRKVARAHHHAHFFRGR